MSWVPSSLTFLALVFYFQLCKFIARVICLNATRFSLTQPSHCSPPSFSLGSASPLPLHPTVFACPVCPGRGPGMVGGGASVSPHLRRQLRMRPSLLQGLPSVCPQVHPTPPLITICPIWTTLGEMKGGAQAGGPPGMGSAFLHLSLTPTGPPHVSIPTCFSKVVH